MIVLKINELIIFRSMDTNLWQPIFANQRFVLIAESLSGALANKVINARFAHV